MNFYVIPSPLPEDEIYEAAWTMKCDFKCSQGDERIIQTNCFQIPYLDTTLWKLRMESTYDPCGTGTTMLKLIMVDSDQPIEDVSGKITLKNIQGDITFKKVFGPCSFQDNYSKMEWSSKGPNISLDGTTLRIRIRINGCKSVPSLRYDMSKLLLADDFSDVVLKVGDKSFQAHKAILGARSSVFKTMFKSGMQEQLTSVVKIEDIDSEVIEEMLRYAYLGQVNNLEELSLGLIMAAHKYNMRGLEIKCIDSLLRTLNYKNSLERLTVAGCINNAPFRRNLIDFIAMNLSDAIELPDWDAWATSHPILLNLVLKAVCWLKFP